MFRSRRNIVPEILRAANVREALTDPARLHPQNGPVDNAALRSPSPPGWMACCPGSANNVEISLRYRPVANPVFETIVLSAGPHSEEPVPSDTIGEPHSVVGRNVRRVTQVDFDGTTPPQAMSRHAAAVRVATSPLFRELGRGPGVP
jgi:hypothetical protein